jgi:hypothetical protein
VRIVRSRWPSVLLGAVAGLAVAGAVADPAALVEPLAGDPAIVSDAHGGLTEIVVHYRRDFHEQSRETLEDLVAALPPGVTIRVVVERREEFDFLVQHLEEMGIPDHGRLEPVVAGFEISPWSKDRFGTLERRGHPVVAVPPHRAAVSGARGNDERIPDLLCAELEHVQCRALPFYFEGGDLISDERHVFVAATLLERNPPLTEARRAELLEQIGDELRRDVVPIGREGTDVPDHHIGMYLTPLGDGVVAVASPAAGARLYRALPTREQTLELQDDPVEIQRFTRIADDLRDQGFTVVEVPLLLTTTPRVYVSYNNALLERRGDDQIVYMPVYGIETLDLAAAEVFRDLGWRVESIRVEDVYTYTGSLRCLVGVVSRA